MISVIIPIFNKKPYLQDAINSVLNQTMEWEKYEIILINDGSTDGCGEICDKYTEKYKNIKTIHQNNKGVSAARNTGLRHAKGNYIIFLDADDMLAEECLEKSQRLIEKNGIDFLQFGMGKYLGTNMESNLNIPMKILSGTAALKEFYNRKNIMLVAWGCLYKKEIIKEIKFNESLHLGEDTLFKYEVLKKSEKVGIINNKWYLNRAVEGSLSRKQLDLSDLDNVIYVLENIESHKVKSDEEEKECSFFLFNQYFAYLNRIMTEDSILEKESVVARITNHLDNINIKNSNARIAAKKALFWLYKNNPSIYLKLIVYLKNKEHL